MPKPALMSVGLLLLVLPAWASEPVAPLTADDWEILDPSLSVTIWAPRVQDCGSIPQGDLPPTCALGAIFPNRENLVQDRVGSLVDPAGKIWAARSVVDRIDGSPNKCGADSRFTVYNVELFRCSAGECVTVARLPGRCHTPGVVDNQSDQALVKAMWLDVTNGYLYVRIQQMCVYNGCSGPYAYGLNGEEIHRFQGLPTMFEVMQYFAPTSGIGFTVPAQPEGMPSLDWFDTYWGDLTNPIDFSQAQPLLCQWPITFVPLEPGTYLTIPDTLPVPSPGQGYYILTASNYMGERRYGRKAISGRFSGRDPALLPVCE